MILLIIYLVFSYLFILGGLIEIEKKLTWTNFTTLLFSPLILPMFFGLYYFRKHNEKCKCIPSEGTINSH